MSDKYILNDNGDPEPCGDFLEWARWFELADRTVARDERDGVAVSTVFLGLDHAFGGMVPLLFETLVFGGALDGDGERYATRADAERGHQRYCEKVFGNVPSADERAAQSL